MKPKLTLCMIVRNEAEVLERCLVSIQGLCDETVVVDTGSTDGTVGIAERLGARVHRFEWCDDFAAARNRSFDLATGEFILWLDADDVLAPESLRRVIELKPRLAREVYYLPYDYAQDEYGRSTCMLYRERIVRNLPAIMVPPETTGLRSERLATSRSLNKAPIETRNPIESMK
jgi:glycosyltransferase involved in cell wall biosynthesis